MFYIAGKVMSKLSERQIIYQIDTKQWIEHLNCIFYEGCLTYILNHHFIHDSLKTQFYQISIIHKKSAMAQSQIVWFQTPILHEFYSYEKRP